MDQCVAFFIAVFLMMGEKRETNNSNKDAASSGDDNKSIIQFLQTQFDELKKEFNEVESLITVREEKFEELNGQIVDLKWIVAFKDNCIDNLITSERSERSSY